MFLASTASVQRVGKHSRSHTFYEKEDRHATILNIAQTRPCNTVIVGHELHHGLKALFTHHVGDGLLHKGQGLATGRVA